MRQNYEMFLKTSISYPIYYGVSFLSFLNNQSKGNIWKTPSLFRICWSNLPQNRMNFSAFFQINCKKHEPNDIFL